VIMIFSCNLKSGQFRGFASLQQSRETGILAPVASPWRAAGNGEKLLHALNANVISGSVSLRTPCLGGVIADICTAIAFAMLTNLVAAARGDTLIR
jgi:hypothetical protein